LCFQAWLPLLLAFCDSPGKRLISARLQDKSHVPVGQLKLSVEDDEARPAEKLEKIFSVSVEPQLSHSWLPLVPAFSRKEVTWPHFLH